MRDVSHARGPGRKAGNNWLLFFPLALLTGIFTIAGALLAYYIFAIELGYDGGKSGIIYLGGAVAGFSITSPLWKLYRKRYPKLPKPD
uniref:hypothetical protein n=1 Tax=Parerythrobacter lutipelagi TaxID=1964208 RepID=UPI0010F6028D|nr:hypothetical protein [Parerythrobacter lutipelagi]